MNRTVLSRNLGVGQVSTLTSTTTPAQPIEPGGSHSMNRGLRLFAIAIVALFTMACTPSLVRMYNLHGQPIPQGLTQDQVRKAINIGAGTAGWTAKEVSPGSVVATYHIRAHSVTVLISYTERAYNIDYKSSNQMKVYCTEEDMEEKRARKVTSGGGTCPGVDQPAYIHENYKDWVDELNRAIEAALRNIT